MKKKLLISAGTLVFVLSLFAVTLSNAKATTNECDVQYQHGCKEYTKVCYFMLWGNDEKCVFEKSYFKHMSDDQDNGI